MSRPVNIERRKQIAQLIINKGTVSARDLAEEFNVSTETIRKDLIFLEENKIITKGHGGVTVSNIYLESPFSIKSSENIEAKARIAEKAVELIPQNGVVFLDSGSTVLQIAKLLNLKEDLVIITNSLAVAEVLSNTKNKLLVTGGQLRSKSMSFVGPWATQAIDSLHVDVAFMGCDGFHAEGPCIRSYREVEVKQKIIANAKKTILVCDSSKFNVEGLYRFADFKRLGCMLTDSSLPPQMAKTIPTDFQVVIA